jgi:hypothetical protein
VVVVVVEIQLGGNADLLQIAGTLDALSLLSCRLQSQKQNGNQQGHNRDHYQ